MGEVGEVDVRASVQPGAERIHNTNLGGREGGRHNKINVAFKPVIKSR